MIEKIFDAYKDPSGGVGKDAFRAFLQGIGAGSGSNERLERTNDDCRPARLSSRYLPGSWHCSLALEQRSVLTLFLP